MTDARAVALPAATLFAARIAGAGLVFAAQVVVARALGPAALAELLVVAAAVNLVGMLLPLGFHAIAQYYVAAHARAGEADRLAGFLATAATVTGLGAAVLLVALALTPLGGWLPPGGTLALAIAAPAMAATSLLAGIGIALERPFVALLPDLLVRPAALLAGAGAAAAALLASPAAIVTVAALAGWIGILWQAWRLAPVLRGLGVFSSAPRFDLPAWFRLAPAWLAIGLIGEFLIEIDLLMLARLLPAADLAVFGATTRIMALIGFGVAAVHSLVLPAVFSAHAAKDRAGVAAGLTRAARLATLGMAAALTGVAIAGGFVLAAFGPAFRDGALPLAILTAGLLVRAAFGPAAVVASLADRPFAPLPALIAGLATMAAGNLVLVPALGIVGAALAMAAALSVSAIGQWWVALRLSGLDCSVAGRAFTPAPAAGARSLSPG